MAVWWLTIFLPPGNSYLGLKHRAVIAQGWPDLGDLTIVSRNFEAYWRHHRPDFENVIRLFAGHPYPGTAPAAMLNLFNLLSLLRCDLVVAVEAGSGAGQVMGICQIEKDGWESYRHDDPRVFDYAHTVGFPAEWVDWAALAGAAPPNPPAMIAGIQPMGAGQAAIVQDAWQTYQHKHPNACA
jgi:hypothetical protein